MILVGDKLIETTITNLPASGFNFLKSKAFILLSFHFFIFSSLLQLLF